MSNDDPKTKWNINRGDGSSQPLTPEKFDELKNEFSLLARDAGQTANNVNDRRELAANTRFCRWAGQSPDGKKRKAALNGAAPFPFEGASDARVRTADGIVREQVIVAMAAAMRMNVGFKGTEALDLEVAAALNTLWDWVVRNQLGASWMVELTKLANYRFGSAPGVGLMQVNWHQVEALKPLTITAEKVLKEFVEALGEQGSQVEPDQAVDLDDLLHNPARVDELAQLLLELWPKLKPARAAKAAAELVTDGEATFAYPYLCEDRLKVKAHELFNTAFIPENTTDMQWCRVSFFPEWFTEPQLREMDAKGMFKPGFLEELLKHEGENAWQHYSCLNVEGDYSGEAAVRNWDKTKQRGYYQLITAIYWASNSDGLPGVYSVQYSQFVDFPGTDAELWGSKFPVFDSRCELVADKIWDTRGIPELSMTEQNSLKLLHDAFMDHAQLSSVPPIKVPANRPKLALVIKPLVLIKENRQGEIAWMPPPAFPQSNDVVQAKINSRLAEFFGLMTKDNTPDRVRLYQQWLIDFWLLDIAKIVGRGLELCWEFMDDTTLARVMGVDEQQVADWRDKETWKYDVEVSFEAGLLNMDFLKEVSSLITTALGWDTLSTVQRDRLVRWFMGAISPSLARGITVPVDEANTKEAADEENIFTKMAAGIASPMVTQGQNFKLRLQVELDIPKKNPEAFTKLTPASRQMYDERLQHLAGMVQQQQNAQTGRVQVEQTITPPLTPGPVLPQQEAAAAGV